MTDPEDAERAIRYAGSTEFTEMGLAKLGAMLSTMDDAMSDDDGSVRKDMRMKAATAADLAACTLTEKVIAPGRDGHRHRALGRRARGPRAEAPRASRSSSGSSPGAGRRWWRTRRSARGALLVFALVWAGFAHAIICLVLTKAPEVTCPSSPTSPSTSST